MAPGDVDGHDTTPAVPACPGRVVIVGTGLIGTSTALALRERGCAVWLSDVDRAAARLAADLGAGELLPDSGPGRPEPPPSGPADVAVLAVPPAAVADALAAVQARDVARWFTDTASVKVAPLRQARAVGCDMSRYVPGHPLAGRERSGPAAARGDLFLGRPWALCPGPETSGDAVHAVTSLVRACGAEPVVVDAATHDRWVALVSHAPHVVASAVAARLAADEVPQQALTLAGPGIADVTRIAAGDVDLWSQILTANAACVADVLRAVVADLQTAADALTASAPRQTSQSQAGGGWEPVIDGASGRDREEPRETGAQPGQPTPPDSPLTRLLERGRTGVGRLPGKHGGPARTFSSVQVVIRDRPGELARLLSVAGAAGVNIEDVGIEHSPGQPVGVAELFVQPATRARLVAALAADGWPVRR